MGNGITKQIASKDPKKTEKLGQQIGSQLRGGEVIELHGDLGTGKTTFVRGLVRGISSEDHVASPSFTLSRQYKSDKFTIHHMDFYRLNEAGIMNLEIEELITNRTNVIVVEWADVTEAVLPNERLIITFMNGQEQNRTLKFVCPAKMNYLLEGLS